MVELGQKFLDLMLTHMVRPTLVRIDNFERRINQQNMFKNMQGNAFFISVNFNFFQRRGRTPPSNPPGRKTRPGQRFSQAW